LVLTDKQIWSAAAIILSFAGFYPYIRSILRGQTRPHVFSWVIWSITTLIVYFAQAADKGGAGAWPTGVTGLITVYVAWLAYKKKSDIRITHWDWFFFGLALASIPAWHYSSNPFLAVFLLTATDVLGSIPTFQKAYRSPFSENLVFYLIMGIRSLVSIYALESYSWTTVLFPAVLTIMCAILIAILAVRRKNTAAGSV